MTGAHEQKLLITFGRRMAVLRKQRGLTQQQLAEKVGMSVVAIAYIETGKRWPRLATLSAVARCLEVNLRDFFEGV